MSSNTEVEKLKKANLMLSKEIQSLKVENSNFKKIIKKNRQLEDTIHLLVESTGLGIWDHNLKTNKVIRNSQWAEQLGYSLNEINPDFIQFKNLVHPKDFPKFKKAESKHLSGKQPYYKVEHRMKTKDGKWKWILNWGRFVKKDKDGNPIRAVGTHIDITKFKEVEEKLKKSEKQYKALFDYAPIGLWEQDVTELVQYLQQIKKSGVKDFNEFFSNQPTKLDECINKIKPLKINKAALKIHEAESLQSIQNNFDKVFTQKSKNVFKDQIIAQANGASIFEAETETRTFTGKIKKLKISISFSFLPYRDKKVILFSISDITAQKAAEKSLAESENKYKSLYTLFRTMADNLPDMLWAKDINKKYLFSNEAMCKGLLIAKNTDEPIGKTDLFFANRQRKIKPKNKKYHTFGELCQDSDDVVLKTQKAQRFDEYGNVKNKFLFLDVHKAPFYDLAGNIIGTVGSARDITKEIEMENALNTIEEKYKKIFELVPTSIIITDSKGAIVDVNSNIENIITEKPFAKSECKGKKVIDAKTIIEAGLVNEIKGLLKGKGFESRERFFPITAFGYPGYFNIQGVPILEKDKVVGAVISSENITEQVTLAKTLMDNEEYFKYLFYSNPLPMYVFDSKSLKFLDVNQAFIDKYGFSREEFFEMTLFDIRPFKEKKKLEEDVKKSKFDIEKSGVRKHKKKSGELIYVDVTTFNINFFGREGKLVLANDITQSLLDRKELEKSQKEIRLFADHLELVREKERTNIAREIHDDLGQSLTALKIDLSWLSKNCEKSDNIVHDKIKASKELINSLIKTVQKISTELRPGIIDDLGLAAAIEWQVDEFIKRTGLKCNLDIYPANLNLNEQLSVNIFRIIQEALTNIIRHAKAKRVDIVLEEKKGTVNLKIVDDGIGITKQQINSINSFGIMSIKERVIKFNGKVLVRGIKNKGTRLNITIPYSIKKEIYENTNS